MPNENGQDEHQQMGRDENMNAFEQGHNPNNIGYQPNGYQDRRDFPNYQSERGSIFNQESSARLQPSPMG